MNAAEVHTCTVHILKVTTHVTVHIFGIYSNAHQVIFVYKNS